MLRPAQPSIRRSNEQLADIDHIAREPSYGGFPAKHNLTPLMVRSIGVRPCTIARTAIDAYSPRTAARSGNISQATDFFRNLSYRTLNLSYLKGYKLGSGPIVSTECESTLQLFTLASECHAGRCRVDSRLILDVVGDHGEIFGGAVSIRLTQRIGPGTAHGGTQGVRIRRHGIHTVTDRLNGCGDNASTQQRSCSENSDFHVGSLVIRAELNRQPLFLAESHFTGRTPRPASLNPYRGAA